MVTGGGSIVSASTTVAVLVASVASAAVSVTFDVPRAAGVPVIAPVAGSSANPAGRPLADQANAPLPPLAASTAENGSVARTHGNAVVAMATGTRAGRSASRNTS